MPARSISFRGDTDRASAKRVRALTRIVPSGVSGGSVQRSWKGSQPSTIRHSLPSSGVYSTQISMPPLTVRLSDRHSFPRRIVCPQAHSTLPTSGIPSGRRSSWVCSEFCTSFTAAVRQGNSAF